MATEFLSTPTIQRYYFTQYAAAARTVSDGVTASSTTVTSATAAFISADVGAAITGTGIPGSTTIASVTNATTVVLSAAATATATGVSLTITRTTANALAVFQTAVNTDFASALATVPQILTMTALPTVALFIVSPQLVLSVSPGSYLGLNYGNWQVLPSSSMSGLLFTPASV